MTKTTIEQQPNRRPARDLPSLNMGHDEAATVHAAEKAMNEAQRLLSPYLAQYPGLPVLEVVALMPPDE